MYVTFHNWTLEWVPLEKNRVLPMNSSHELIESLDIWAPSNPKNWAKFYILRVSESDPYELMLGFVLQIPNALGFVLGTVQLILYFIYNNKSQSTEPADDVSDNDSSAQPVKEGIEMNSSYNNGKNLENKSLHKGNNLSKPSVDQEYNLQTIVKSHSYEVYATDYSDETDVEKGHVDYR